jgi:hypothetical protein
MLASAAVGVLVAIVQGTCFEWLYHRYWLHRPWLPPQMFTAHTLVHHQLCKHDDTFHVTEPEQEEALTFQWWAGPVLVAINLLPWAVVAWGLARAGVTLPASPFLVAFSATVFAYYLAYEGFHYLMHKPSIPWIERSAPFRFIEHHHRLHHVHMGTNFNVVLPLADLWFGTLLLRDPLPPQRTTEAAKRVARQHSAWGRKLRERDRAAKPAAAQDDAREHEPVA